MLLGWGLGILVYGYCVFKFSVFGEMLIEMLDINIVGMTKMQGIYQITLYF